MMSFKTVRILVAVLIVALIVGALSACGDDDKQKEEQKPLTQTSVVFTWLHGAEFAGFYAASAEGYYAEEGLEVRLEPGGFTSEGYIDPIQRVSTGQVEFGLATAEQIFSARKAGQPVVAIAVLFQNSPRVFISLAENNITRPEDFVGKRVAVRDDIQIVYTALLKSAGVEAADVVVVTDPALFSLEALVNGEVDVTPGFIINEPVQLEMDGHPVNTVFITDYGLEDFQDIIFTTEDTIKNKPDLVTQFLRATLKGYDYLLQNPDQAASLAQQYAPDFSLDALKARVARMVPLIGRADKKTGWIEPTLWQNFYQLLLDQGLLDATVDANAAYTLDFLNEIYSQ